ncbi:MAG TPA: phage tail family protein [Mammaliicoccus lentus]|nr:phage tail domain-containing protein [Mammaliicoccus lentus]HJF22787.1 phage tail family protein [Mammaliicoccus lentus]
MRWAYIIDESGTTYISGDDCHFLESEITEVNTKTVEQEMSGMDGVLVGANTFGSFELTLKFYYDGVDSSDLILFTEKIKKIIHTRKPMYVVHSELPARKYAFNSAKVDWEKITNSDTTFSITFNVYKGYSESLHDTDEFSLSNGNFQFESGVLPDSNTSYRFNRSMFEVLNGSSDTIDPRHRHKLKIIIRMTTDEGFRLVNKTTGDIFEYKSDLDINRQMTIDGGYPYIQQNDVRARCGRLTNHGLITLAPGINKFEVWGNFKNLDIQFIFPFIYR